MWGVDLLRGSSKNIMGTPFLNESYNEIYIEIFDAIYQLPKR